MNLVFIYGPPATGKSTVAKELSLLTGYKVFPNHKVLDLLSSIFPYDDASTADTRKRLSRDLRLDIFREAAKSKISFITTFGMAGSEYFKFFREINDNISDLNGKVLFVQLYSSKDELLKRVENSDRKSVKIDSKEYLDNLLQQNPEIFDQLPDFEHLSIDNTDIDAKAAAAKITDYYSLII